MSLSQLSQLLPLPDDELQQVLDYADTLSKTEAASHLSNLLGDAPLAVDFISSFNARRENTSTSHPSKAATDTSSAGNSSAATVPRCRQEPPSRKKKKASLRTPQARAVGSYAGPAATAYNKKETDLEYISQRTSPTQTDKHESRSATTSPPPPPPPPPKQASSSSATTGFLISDTLGKKTRSKTSGTSSTPNAVMRLSGRSDNNNSKKISISGGTPMAGQSTALTDLDNAIRALEISTNPSLDDPDARRCRCVATRHPLQTAAPNCLSCGKVVCVREGLGPCTYCGAPLLPADDVQAMVRELRDQRGRERMAAHHQHSHSQRGPAAAAASSSSSSSSMQPTFSRPRGHFGSAAIEAGPSLTEAAARAREHRDKLLGFQSQNAKRTTVRDEAADFDVSVAVAATTNTGTGGGSMWASPEERARELKRQQKVLREMEWQARPEYEKRRQVMSIDLVNGRVVRKMAPAERPPLPEDDDDDDADADGGREHDKEQQGQEVILSHGAVVGAFSNNPLLGALLKPVFRPAGTATAGSKMSGGEASGSDKVAARARRERRKGWRRVQDDQDDNEGMILDGGVHGHAVDDVTGDEPGCA